MALASPVCAGEARPEAAAGRTHADANSRYGLGSVQRAHSIDAARSRLRSLALPQFSSRRWALKKPAATLPLPCRRPAIPVQMG
jgi:hypothetical protein